jgi:hypothetical protein
MSPWAVAIAGLAAVVFLSLPLMLGQASRSGRMAQWDAREASGLSDRQQRIAWRLRLGTRLFITAAFLGVMFLFLARREFVNALIVAAFLAFQVWLLVVMLRVRPSS